MAKIRIDVSRLEYDPKTNEYLLESPLTELGSIYGVKTYVETYNPKTIKLITEYLRKLFKV